MKFNKNYIKSISNRIFKSKIFENYASMTFIQGTNLIISLLLYPYLIRILGKEAYGTYVMAMSIISFFTLFVGFGFNLPALKQISINQNNLTERQKIISFVFTGKSILFLFALIILILLMIFVPFFRINYRLYLIVFSVVVADVIFPIWYFQGMQNMKVVTFIQIGVKLFFIPFIFIFVKSSANLLIFVLILSLMSVVSAVISAIYLKIKENISLRFVKISQLKTLFKESLLLFFNNLLITAKLEGVTLIIGVFIGVGEVAIYDLAKKIMNILQLATNSINTALFPKAVTATKELVRKMIFYEGLFGAVAFVLLLLFGYPLILLLGGEAMTGAYPLMLILSVTLITWMIANCYFSFVFVPKNLYNYIFGNQVVAVISFFVLVTAGLLISRSIFSVVIALAVSSFFELFYCLYVTKKYKLF